jgi:hypothetical protein
MKIFPKISPKQYFVIFAEQATGIVINHVGMYSLEGDDQLWYSIFDSSKLYPFKVETESTVGRLYL